MAQLETLDPAQLDALKEVANIGAGHAATALSEMTRRRVMLTVPRVTSFRLEEAAAEIFPGDEPCAAVELPIVGDVPGHTLLVLDLATARGLCAILLRRPLSSADGFDEIETSALEELANILISAYVSALSAFLGLVLLPSLPELVVDRPRAIFDPLFRNAQRRSDPVLCVETRFRLRDEEGQLTANFLLIPDPEALPAIFRSVRLAG